MKREHIQNELKNHVGDFVRTEAKEATVLWLHEKGLPAAREVSAAYTAALRESAEKETGWCRFRDRIFLPLVIEGAIWMTGKMLERMTSPHSVKRCRSVVSLTGVGASHLGRFSRG